MTSTCARAHSTPSCSAGSRPVSLDILDAFVVTAINGGTPTRVLHAIASGVLGRGAYQGGVPAAALGLLLHFVIAIGAATTYFLASRKLPVLLRRPVLCGVAFGLGVWAVMYYVVLPITFSRPNTLPAWPQLAQSTGHPRIWRRPADRVACRSICALVWGQVTFFIIASWQQSQTVGAICNFARRLLGDRRETAVRDDEKGDLTPITLAPSASPGADLLSKPVDSLT